MNIERLKELKTNLMFEKDVSDEATRFDRDSETNRTVHQSCNDLIALIDAEIARQTVKSEDVTEAIAWVKDEIADLSYGDDEVEASYPHREDEILNTILNALQEYQLKGE